MTTTLQAKGPSDTSTAPAGWTMADLLKKLGGISPRRILLLPPPGTATEKDLLRAESKYGRLCELVEGTLVEKGMGFHESLLAAFFIAVLQPFVRKYRLGVVTSPDLFLRLFPCTVRAPDVAFVSWSRLPGRKIPKAPIPSVSPDLAIEVLSKSNTKKEMERKRREYFGAGTRLVWEVDPRKRIIVVHDPSDDPVTLKESDVLDGGVVLPGFKLALRDVFAELDVEGP